MAVKKVSKKKAGNGVAKKTKKGVPTPRGELVEHASLAPCSVEFSRDAKQQPKWNLKLYCESHDMDEAVTKLLGLDARLRKETVQG